MDVSSESGSPKRTRAKTAAKVVASKAERRTLTTRKTTAAVIVDLVPETPFDLAGRIATAAFYLAADRNFAPGHELDDWLEAERRVLGGIP